MKNCVCLLLNLKRVLHMNAAYSQFYNLGVQKYKFILYKKTKLKL